MRGGLGPIAVSRRRAATTIVALAGLLAVFFSQFAWVRATNFGGTDEWLYISLASRRALDIPYANRPFVLLWTLPAALVWPHDLRAYYVVHTAYLSLAGCLLFLLMRRLEPSRPLLAFLAAAISLTWAPLDFLRLDTVLLTGYSGYTRGRDLPETFASVSKPIDHRELLRLVEECANQ